MFSSEGDITRGKSSSSTSPDIPMGITTEFSGRKFTNRRYLVLRRVDRMVGQQQWICLQDRGRRIQLDSEVFPRAESSQLSLSTMHVLGEPEDRVVRCGDRSRR